MSISSPRAMSGRHCPLNCWWVAATSNELTSAPISRQLLHSRLVLARTQSGVIALDDRCPHRRAPLSRGKLVGDEIECAYHGIRFDREGRCTLVPSEPNRAHTLKVRSYPVQERGPFVWIWMGTPEKADSAVLPDLQWPLSPTHLRVGGYAEVKCSFVVLLENFMDVTHFPFVHEKICKSIATPQKFIQARSFVSQPQVREHIVSMTTQGALPPTDAERRSLELVAGDILEKTAEYRLTLPSCLVQHTNVVVLSDSSGVPRRHFVHGALCATAISPNRCHFWWETIQDYGVGLAEYWQAFYEAALKDDIAIVEAVQATIDEDTARTREVLVASDRAVAHMRRALRSMLQAESH